MSDDDSDDHYAISMVTQPTVEPITVAEVKRHLRIDDSDTSLDADVALWILVARRFVENYCNRALVQQTFDLLLDRFPCDGEICVPRAPLQSVTSITYLDGTGTTQTLASTNYQVDTATEPARIMPKWGSWWPATLSRQLNAVTIRCVAGYPVGSPQDATGLTENIPAEIRHAMKMLIGHLDQHREMVSDQIRAISEEEVPHGTRWLLAPYRLSMF